MHAALVLGVADPGAVGRPAGVALVMVRSRQGPGLTPRAGRDPEVQPAAALGAEEQVLAVGRRLDGAERPARAVVEKAAVRHRGARIPAVGGDLDHVVIHPAVVHAHVEERPGIRGPARIPLVERVAGQPVHLSSGDRHLPDVHVAEPVAGERDPRPVRRPGEPVRPRREPGEPPVRTLLGRPQPDVRRAVAVGGVGDEAPVGRPDRLRGPQRSHPAERQVPGENPERPVLGVHAGEVARGRHECDPGSVRRPLRGTTSPDRGSKVHQCGGADRAGSRVGGPGRRAAFLRRTREPPGEHESGRDDGKTVLSHDPGSSLQPVVELA